MKTIQHIQTNEIVRDVDSVTETYVNSGFWVYVSKSTLKEQTINSEVKNKTKPKKIKSNKMSKAQNRHSRRKK